MMGLSGSRGSVMRMASEVEARAWSQSWAVVLQLLRAAGKQAWQADTAGRESEGSTKVQHQMKWPDLEAS